MTLDSRILDHKALYRADLLIRPTQHAVPSDTEPILIGGHYVDVTDSGELGGMPFSMAMARRLGHPENYGSLFPWTKALWLLRVECRRKHPYHRGPTVPYWRGSLCHQLVTFVIVRDWSVENTAKILRYDDPEPVLRQAFDFLERTVDDFRARAERRVKEDAGLGEGAVPQPVRRCYHPDCNGRPHYEAKPHPDHQWHREECPQCRAA